MGTKARLCALALIGAAAAGAGAWTLRATAQENFASELPKRWWTAATDLATQEVESSLEIVWAAQNCPQTAINAERPRDLGHYLFDVIGLRVAPLAWPQDLQVEQANLFWQLGGRYFQLAMTWREDEPATYQLELLSSARPDLSNPQDVALPGVPENRGFDIDTATDYADRLLAHADSLGAVRGARILSLSRSVLSDAGQSEWHRAQFLNGKAISYEGPAYACRYDFGKNAAVCDCAKEHNHDG